MSRLDHMSTKWWKVQPQSDTPESEIVPEKDLLDIRRCSATWSLHVELTRFDKATLNNTSSASDFNNELPILRGDSASNLLVHSVQENVPL